MENETVALATYLEVLKFNDGDILFIKLFEDLNIKPGVFTCQGVQDCDESRVEKTKEPIESKENIEALKKNVHR